jgi:hypothetical protein
MGHVLADIGQKAWALGLSETLGSLDRDDLAALIAADEAWGVRVEAVGEPEAAPVCFSARLSREAALGPTFFELNDQNDWRLDVRMARRSRRQSNHYFGTSIVLLFHHLLRLNANDEVQVSRLAATARVLAGLHSDGFLRLPIRWSWAAANGAQRVWEASPSG